MENKKETKKMVTELVKSEYELTMVKGENEPIVISGLERKEAVNTGNTMIKAGYTVTMQQVNYKKVEFLTDAEIKEKKDKKEADKQARKADKQARKADKEKANKK